MEQLFSLCCNLYARHYINKLNKKHTFYQVHSSETTTEFSHNRRQGDDFIDTLHYPTPTVTVSHGHNGVLYFGSQPLMNPVRHSIHSLPVYTLLLLPMYLTSPPESVYRTSEGICGVVLFRKVGSTIGYIKNSESCRCGISEDFTGVGSWRQASWTECAGTSLTWPMGLSTGTCISSLSGCGS